MRIFVLIVSVLGIAQTLELPSYITQCSKSDPKLSECLQKSVNRAWPTIAKGDKKYHIQPLNPLKVPFVHVTVGNTLQGNLTDALFHGLENNEIKEVKWDFSKRRVETQFVIPQFKYTGEYVLQGRLLGLPIEGHGDCDVSFANMACKHHFDYNIVERDGREYIDIKQTEMSYSTTKLVCYLGNLFNGNKQLGKAMNEVINENWDAANREINPYLGNAIGEVYSHVLQAFFDRVPLNKIFSN